MNTSLPDNIKEQERAQLHSTIWKIANDLRLGRRVGFQAIRFGYVVLPLHIGKPH